MVKFKKLCKDAIIPNRAHDTDAGLDICCSESVVIPAREHVLVSTGIACEFPKNYVLKVENKSGRSMKYGLLVGGGIIDSGYRGEIKVILFNLSNNKIALGKGEKIAQLILYPIWYGNSVEVNELSDTIRGVDGFGSTGNFVGECYCEGCDDLNEDCCGGYDSSWK
jgi:dUTP pyrophosphatase